MRRCTPRCDEVGALQATVGADAADLALKAAAKRRLDTALQPLRLLARAWSGAVMLATREVDDEWLALARAVAATGTWPERLTERQAAMLDRRRVRRCRGTWRSRRCSGVKGPGGRLRCGAEQSAMGHHAAEYSGILRGTSICRFWMPRDGTEAHAIRDRLLADPSVAKAWRGYQAVFARPATTGGKALPASETWCAWQRHGRQARPLSCVCRANGGVAGR